MGAQNVCVEAKNGAVVGLYARQIRITLMRTWIWIWIRIRVKSRIRIRIKLIEIRITVWRTCMDT
jgi:hypothetical protein